MPSPPPIASSTKGRTTFACGSVELAQLSGIARWSLSVTGAADCCAELFPLFQHHCAMSARDVWGFSIIRYFILGLSCVRAAYVHDVCVWFRRASRRSCQVGARCGHFVWLVLLAPALSCRPCTALLRHFGQRCLGLQRWVLVCFRSPVRQPLYAPRVRVAGVRAVTQL